MFSIFSLEVLLCGETFNKGMVSLKVGDDVRATIEEGVIMSVEHVTGGTGENGAEASTEEVTVTIKQVPSSSVVPNPAEIPLESPASPNGKQFPEEEYGLDLFSNTMDCA